LSSETIAPPEIRANLEISTGGTARILIPQASPGKLFKVQHTEDLTSNQWMNLGALIQGEGIDLEVVIDDVNLDTTARIWFRIQIAP